MNLHICKVYNALTVDHMFARKNSWIGNDFSEVSYKTNISVTVLNILWLLQLVVYNSQSNPYIPCKWIVQTSSEAHLHLKLKDSMFRKLWRANGSIVQSAVGNGISGIVVQLVQKPWDAIID